LKMTIIINLNKFWRNYLHHLRLRKIFESQQFFLIFGILRQ